MKKTVLPFLLLGLLAVNPVSAQGRYPVPVGETHPDFRLMNVDTGEPVSLSDYRGQKVLLIHFASW